MKAAELTAILQKHKKWLDNDPDGERADLQGADLRGADLRGADLRRADLQGANLRGAYLRRADLQGANLRRAALRLADLQGANLRGAYLRYADLQGAYLQGADLDYSCLPLWCGGSRFTCDIRLVHQILAHVATLAVTGDDADEFADIQKLIMPYAVKSHRASDLGLLEDHDEKPTT